MIDAIKGWVINICTAMFFITAVEMILPSNAMKKYAKFVLGLILITVIVNPIIKIFNSNINMENYINTTSQYLENKEYKNNYDEFKNKSIDKTTQVFASNLENLCTQKLKDKYQKDSFQVSIKAQYSTKKEKLDIDKIVIEVNEGKIRRVKKVQVGEKKVNANNKSLDEYKSKEIVKYISEILSVPKDKIRVYKM